MKRQIKVIFLLSVLLSVGLMAHAETKFLCGASAVSSPTATPAPTPSPTPTPEFIVGVHSHTTGTLTYTGVQAGDCLVSVTAQGTPNTPINGWGQLQYNGNNIGGVFIKIVTPQDTTSIVTPFSSPNGVCAAAFRYLTCSSDGISTVATGTNGSPTSNSFTTTVANDFAILVSYLNSSATGAYTEPSGYIQAAFEAPISGTNYGCDLGYKALSTAGVNSPSAGTLTNPSAWSVFGFGLNGTGFVY